MEEEIWKDIPNYEGLYQASNLGRIKSVKRYVNTYNGKAKCLKLINENILKPNHTLNGYLKVSLSKNGKAKTFLVHLLVARTFIGYSILQIDHIDGNKQNNNISNLEYVTQKENTNRAWNKKLISRKKNEIDQYDINNNYIKTWFNAGDIERELKINHSLVIACCRGKRNKTGNYKWKYHTEQ